MKKKLFFVLLLSGSMFLNFNIADAKGRIEVTTFSQYNNTTIANDGGGVNAWEYMYTVQPYAFYRNSVTGQWRTGQVTGTVDHVFRIIGDGWGSAGGGLPLEPTINW